VSLSNMRNVILSIALFVSACATTSTNTAGPRVNVASVRHDINEQIQADTADRSVISMGKVTGDRAVVFTQLKTGARQEETWSKAGGNWKLETAAQVSAN